MTAMIDRIGSEDFFAASGQPDHAAQATRARAMIWQLMRQAVQENASPTMTLADLSATVTRSAARILGMDEDDLAQLLRDHPPH